MAVLNLGFVVTAVLLFTHLALLDVVCASCVIIISAYIVAMFVRLVRFFL